MTIIRELLPSFWACALLYDDYSGLEQPEDSLNGSIEDEIQQIEQWQNDHPNWYCIKVYDDLSFYNRHDATKYGVLPCDCSTFEFNVLNKN
jgi:hypothetical protein